MYDMNIPVDRIISVFGHGNPNPRELDAYKNMIWRQTVRYRKDIRRDILVREVMVFMDDLGFYNIFDYQIRERQIRFREQQLIAQANLAGFHEFIRD